MILRRIGGFIRGKATPFQLSSACVLASMAAFIPGFSQAPGLMILWLIFLIVLNANLFVAGLVGAATKILSLLLMPVSFAIGRLLLDGPTEGLFGAMINAPVLAWFGLEFYVVTGGMVTGLAFGIACGIVVVKLMRVLWKGLAGMETDSAAYQKWASNRWVKIAAFIFVGGVRGKKSFADLHAQRLGNPVRIPGVILVVVVFAVVFVGVRFVQGPFLTAAIRSGLESANGATVDLERAELDLAGGRLALHGLALADPEELTRNLFAAKSVGAQISTADLLRKRAALDQVVVVGGVEGGSRAVPGERIGGEPKSPEWSGMELPDAKSLEDLVKNAGQWKDRLSMISRWLERLSSSDTSEPGGPTYEEVLRERVRLLGYAGVRNDSLIEDSPTFLIRRLEADEVTSSRLPGELLTIKAENLSTQPRLTPNPPTISVTSASGKLRASLAFGADPSTPGANVDLVLRQLAVDGVAAQLAGDDAPVRGGTMDIAVAGLLSAVDSDLPLQVTLHNTSLSIAGSRPTDIPELTVPIAVRGPIGNPAIRVDQAGLQNALVSAGKSELSRRLSGELQKKLGGSGPDGAGAEAPVDVEKAAKDLLGGFLKPKEKKKEEEPPKADD